MLNSFPEILKISFSILINLALNFFDNTFK